MLKDKKNPIYFVNGCRFCTFGPNYGFPSLLTKIVLSYVCATLATGGKIVIFMGCKEISLLFNAIYVSMKIV